MSKWNGNEVKLSVCIPVYNVAPYIEKCARSLFEQTYDDIEYVFVDDCSPDDSMDIVRRVLKDYPDRTDQVKFLRHDRNCGLISARKTAIRAATGELVAHCDPDDWLNPDFYAKLVRRLEESGAEMALGSICGESADGRHLSRTLNEGQMSGAQAITGVGRIPALTSMVNKVYRRDLYRRFEIVWPDNIRIAEDVCHMMQLLARSACVVTVPNAVYHYRHHGSSMTNAASAERIVSDHIAVFGVLLKTLPRPDGELCLRYLVRTILYWGLAHGGLSCREFRRWRKTLRELNGVFDFHDRCRTGQRVMALARFSPEVARLMAILKRRHIQDIL